MRALLRFRFAAPGLVALALLAALPVAGARADQPTRTVEDASRDFTTDACGGFPVRVQYAGHVTSLAFDANGTGTTRQFVGGAVVATLTNLATGASLRVNISGPLFFDTAPDGSIDSPGPGPWLFPFGNPITDEDGIWLLRGVNTLTVDADGTASWSFVGTSQNLCPDLAA
jgi:hypothetical protein